MSFISNPIISFIFLLFAWVKESKNSSNIFWYFSLFIITGFAGYLIHKHIKNNHIQDVKNNVHKIQDFYDKIQSFLSEGADYFCKDGEKNLFVIAYEKDRNNFVKEICLFPYYLNGLRDSVCPTLGNNALPGSNTEYYRTLLDACK